MGHDRGNLQPAAPRDLSGNAAKWRSKGLGSRPTLIRRHRVACRASVPRYHLFLRRDPLGVLPGDHPLDAIREQGDLFLTVLGIRIRSGVRQIKVLFVLQRLAG